MDKKRIVIVICGAVAAALAAVVTYQALSKPSREEIVASARDEAREMIVRYGKTGDAATRQAGHDLLKRKFTKSRRTKANSVDDFITVTTNDTDGVKETFKPEFTKEERELMDKAFSALSGESVAKARAVAREALKSKNPEVRKAAVEALGRFGEAGLAELSQFLGDEDAEVAALAKDLFAINVQQIDADAERISVAKLAMLSMSDRGELDEMSGVLTLSDNHALVISALADVIADGTAVQSEAAKAAYEAVTGDAWTGEAAAEAWLQENYVPDAASEDVPNDAVEHKEIVITLEDFLNGR